MPYKSKTRPLCRCCGKRMPKYTLRIGVLERPPVCAFDASRHHIGVLRNREECQRATKKKVTSVSYGIGDPDPDNFFARLPRVSSFSTWDGVSYTDQYFCKGACAQAYAYMVVASSCNRCTSLAYDVARRKQLA